MAPLIGVTGVTEMAAPLVGEVAAAVEPVSTTVAAVAVA
jgi:hypothetical protein